MLTPHNEQTTPPVFTPEQRYIVDGMIPAGGVLGLFVGEPKTGKTTTALQLLRNISTGEDVLGRPVTKTRVLHLAIDDHRAFVAWVLRGPLREDEDAFYVYFDRMILNHAVIVELEALLEQLEIGLMCVSTLVAGVRELVRCDDAGLAGAVEALKASTRRTGIPYIFEANTVVGQDDDAGCGAETLAAADFVLSLKRDGSGVPTRRVLSGAGPSVHFAPVHFDYNPRTGALIDLGSADQTTGRVC